LVCEKGSGKLLRTVFVTALQTQSQMASQRVLLTETVCAMESLMESETASQIQ
jgi:hypothetical protein